MCAHTCLDWENRMRGRREKGGFCLWHSTLLHHAVSHKPPSCAQGVTGFLKRSVHEAAYGEGAALLPGQLTEVVVAAAPDARGVAQVGGGRLTHGWASCTGCCRSCYRCQEHLKLHKGARTLS